MAHALAGGGATGTVGRRPAPGSLRLWLGMAALVAVAALRLAAMASRPAGARVRGAGRADPVVRPADRRLPGSGIPELAQDFVRTADRPLLAAAVLLAAAPVAHAQIALESPVVAGALCRRKGRSCRRSRPIGTSSTPRASKVARHRAALSEDAARRAAACPEQMRSWSSAHAAAAPGGARAVQDVEQAAARQEGGSAAEVGGVSAAPARDQTRARVPSRRPVAARPAPPRPCARPRRQSRRRRRRSRGPRPPACRRAELTHVASCCRPDTPPRKPRIRSAAADGAPLHRELRSAAARFARARAEAASLAVPDLASRAILFCALFAIAAAYFIWFWTGGRRTLPQKTWRLRVVTLEGRPRRLSTCIDPLSRRLDRAGPGAFHLRDDEALRARRRRARPPRVELPCGVRRCRASVPARPHCGNADRAGRLERRYTGVPCKGASDVEPDRSRPRSALRRDPRDPRAARHATHLQELAHRSGVPDDPEQPRSGRRRESASISSSTAASAAPRATGSASTASSRR